MPGLQSDNHRNIMNGFSIATSFLLGVSLCFSSFILYCFGSEKVYIIVITIGLVFIALAEICMGIKIGARLRCRNK